MATDFKLDFQKGGQSMASASDVEGIQTADAPIQPTATQSTGGDSSMGSFKGVPIPAGSTAAEIKSIVEGVNKPSVAIDTEQLESQTGDVKVSGEFKQTAFDSGISDLEDTVDTQLTELKEGFDSLGEKGQFTADAEEDAGLADIRKAKTDIDNRIRAKQLKARREIEAAQDAFGTRAQKNAIINEITKNNNRELADLAIQQMAIAGDLNAAQATVNRKVDLEFEDRQANLDGLKFLYEENKERLSLAEQREFNQKILEEERTYREEREAFQALEDFRLDMVYNAIEGGAGDSVIQAIQNAKSEEDILKVPGVGSFRQLGTAGGAGSTVSIPSTIGALMSSEILGTEDDPFTDILLATSGGQQMTQSEVEPLTNANRVVTQLDSLAGTVIAENTDPIMGIIRSKNPYDVKAQQIGAEIVALVPQLARGIYGEVGVLTDTDVARYTATLPNMTSTEDVNKAMLALTLRNVRSAFVSQLEGMAASGRDVSGYVGIYERMNGKITSLEEEIGLTQDADANFGQEFDELSQGDSRGIFSSEGKGILGSLKGFFFGE